MGFDFEKAFERLVKVVNDAALQALGSYRGGKMLFLGLGTGLGSALVVEGIVEPMELSHVPYRKRTYEHFKVTSDWNNPCHSTLRSSKHASLYLNLTLWKLACFC